MLGTTDLDKLVVEGGMMGVPDATGSLPGDGAKIKAAVEGLHKNNVEVFISVGGKAYSCRDAAKELNGYSNPPMCVSNWPHTAEMKAAFTAAGLPTGVIGAHVQAFDTAFTSAQYADAWVHLATTFGMDGVDFNDQEVWYVGFRARDFLRVLLC